MGVGQLGGYVELEVFMIRDDGIAQLDHGATLLLESLRTEVEERNVSICYQSYTGAMIKCILAY